MKFCLCSLFLKSEDQCAIHSAPSDSVMLKLGEKIPKYKLIKHFRYLNFKLASLQFGSKILKEI